MPEYTYLLKVTVRTSETRTGFVDRRIDTAVEHSTAREALEEAMSESLRLDAELSLELTDLKSCVDMLDDSDLAAEADRRWPGRGGDL